VNKLWRKFQPAYLLLLVQISKSLHVRQERLLTKRVATESVSISPPSTFQAGSSNDLRATSGGVSLSKVPRLQRRFNSIQSGRFQLDQVRGNRSVISGRRATGVIHPPTNLQQCATSGMHHTLSALFFSPKLTVCHFRVAFSV